MVAILLGEQECSKVLKKNQGKVERERSWLERNRRKEAVVSPKIYLRYNSLSNLKAACDSALQIQPSLFHEDQSPVGSLT